jgi:hypothetical protein
VIPAAVCVWGGGGQVRLNVQTMQEAARVPPVLWAEAQREGLLPADMPLPPMGAL